MKMHLKLLSVKWWPFYPGEDELTNQMNLIRTNNINMTKQYEYFMRYAIHAAA